MDSYHNRTCNVLVLGDSHVYWLEQFVAHDLLHYPQDVNAIDIVYRGTRGGMVSSLRHDTVFRARGHNLPHAANRLIYFSDGCGGGGGRGCAWQYKHGKHFINICYHEQDFGMCAEWNFSSHGKGPCDGAGGTVKRLAVRASLQRAYDNHITTPLQLFQFALTYSIGWPGWLMPQRGDES